ncbi:hypothetical protein [Paracoccus sp. PAR01]|uniref:hypothetical protein n=1 Tax=Paracoccus sp. PAR01 TaxID=2769282 RepID=UPI00177C9E53|nr:hypothetical protein [Paracoccus sp. PAR01]MBD9526631.1 hypothetical protein [Paracoccus sp. PAR01]
MLNPIRKTNTALLAMLLALTSLSAHAATTSREENLANPRGWSAVAGMEPQAVREMARRLPLSEQASGDQPWCGHDAEIAQTLSDDFGESRIATNANDTALWGSDLMGTWTVVLERPDATSCVIASGIGFSDAQSPQSYFTKAGLGS